MSPITGGLQGQPPHPMRRRALWVALGLLGAGCVYDSDEPCGPNEVRWQDSSLCTCADGYAYTIDGCVACGENAVSSPGGCVCVEGYARTQPTNPCEPIPEGIGTSCTTNAECLNPAFNHCQASTSGGYCTGLGCASDADCSGGYSCNLGTSPTFCQRPPQGVGRPCTSDAVCADSEALFCDTFVSGGCLVRDCTISPNSCFAGTECCDLSAFLLPNLCIPVGQCM